MCLSIIVSKHVRIPSVRDGQHHQPGVLRTTVCHKQVITLNVWLWQVQTCTALHIIKHAQALMYLEYCHQIEYESIVPVSRFSTFTKRQKVKLLAALLVT